MKTPTLWTARMGTQTDLPITNSAGITYTSAFTPALKQMLAAVVTVSWKDLMPETADGLIDVEYRMSANGSLEFLRMWAS